MIAQVSEQLLILGDTVIEPLELFRLQAGIGGEVPCFGHDNRISAMSDIEVKSAPTRPNSSLRVGFTETGISVIGDQCARLRLWYLRRLFDKRSDKPHVLPTYTGSALGGEARRPDLDSPTVGPA